MRKTYDVCCAWSRIWSSTLVCGRRCGRSARRAIAFCSWAAVTSGAGDGTCPANRWTSSRSHWAAATARCRWWVACRPLRGSGSRSFARVRTPTTATTSTSGPPMWLASRLRNKPSSTTATSSTERHAVRTLSSALAALPGRAVEGAMRRNSDAVVTTNTVRAGISSGAGACRASTCWQRSRVGAPRRTARPGVRHGGPGLLYQGGLYPRGRAYRESIEALRYLRDCTSSSSASDVHPISRSCDRGRRRLRVVAGALSATATVRRTVRVAAAATVGIVPIKPIDLSSYTIDTNKLFEYLMAGLPVVASDLPEIRRVIASGTPAPGELFDASSPRSIARAIARGPRRIRTSTRPAVARRAASRSSTSTGASTSAGCSISTPRCRTSAFLARRSEPRLDGRKTSRRGCLAELVEVEEVEERHGTLPPRAGASSRLPDMPRRASTAGQTPVARRASGHPRP